MSAYRARAGMLASLVMAAGIAQLSPSGPVANATADPDTAPPVLVAFDFTPQTVDTGGGPASVTVTARITDATGAEVPMVSFDSDSTSETTGFSAMALTSGTAQDGIYTDTISIPQGAATGTWSASLLPLRDTLGNTSSFGLPSGFPTNLVVRTLPGAPTIGVPTIGVPTASNGAAVARWTAPVSDGGSPITGYVVRTYRGTTLVKTVGASAAARSLKVTGLANGTTYTFTVAAKNAAGTGVASAHSTGVKPVTVPGRPRIGTPSRGNASAVARWAAPASTGGSPITRYVVRTYRGTTLVKTVGASAAARSLKVTGLANGTTYTFTVAAKNGLGAGAASAHSTGVRPTAPTSTPTSPPPTGVYYANCDAVRAAGRAPLYRGQPGYRSGLDRDGDGVACES